MVKQLTNIERQFEKILAELRPNFEKSTTELRDLTCLGFYVVQSRLNNMREKGLVLKKETSHGTYWKIKHETY